MCSQSSLTPQSWCQNQLHLADFLNQSLQKIHLSPRTSSKLILHISETLFDIGTDLLKKRQLDGAIKYLRWSYDYILQIARVEVLSAVAGELSMNIRHNLAKALIRRNEVGEMDLERARELVDGLALDAPKEYWMYLLKLEYLERKGGQVDALFACNLLHFGG